MIHGWACDGADWAWLASDLGKDHRRVIIDNRGHGRSSQRAEGYTRASVLEAIRQAPRGHHRLLPALLRGQDATLAVRVAPPWVLSLDEEVVRDVLVGLYDGKEDIGRKMIGETYLRNRKVPMLAIYAGSGAATAEWDRTLDDGPLDEIALWPEHGHFLYQEDPERFTAEVRRWLKGLPASA